MHRAEENASQGLYSTRWESGNNSWQRLWLPPQKCERQYRKWVCGKLHRSQRDLLDIDERIGWCFMKKSWSSRGDLSGKIWRFISRQRHLSVFEGETRSRGQMGRWQRWNRISQLQRWNYRERKKERDLKFLRSIWRQLTTDLSQLESKDRPLCKTESRSVKRFENLPLHFPKKWSSAWTMRNENALHQGPNSYPLINLSILNLKLKHASRPDPFGDLGIQIAAYYHSLEDKHRFLNHMSMSISTILPFPWQRISQGIPEKSFFAGQFLEKKNSSLGSW